MPLLHTFSLIFLVFLMVASIWVIVLVISDLFRSDDLSGWGKALWALGIIVIPWLGGLAYLFLHSEGMLRRSIKAASLAKLDELKEKGVLSEAEFAVQKPKLLG